MADWGGLPGGVLALFAKRLQLIEDFIAFRSACSSWRKATSLTDFDKSCPRLPLVLLDEYAYDIDRKFPDYIYRSPMRDKADVFDKDFQIRGDEKAEIAADEENYESDETDESDEEKSENNVNQVNVDKVVRGKDNEVEEDNSVTDESESDSDSDENYEMEEDNSDTDESTEMDENSDSKSDSDENYENVKIEGDNSDTHESTKMDENSVVDHKSVLSTKMDENSVVNHKSMLSTKMDENSVVNHERMFFSLSKGKGCMISLPEASGMEFIGSKGWLIMVNSCTRDMCLFHPLTRARITLPNAPSEVQFPIYPKHIRCAVLSASPSETSDYVVMVAYVHKNYISGSCLVFWKPGNLTWTRVELEAPARCVEDLTYYNGKFYALTWRSEVWMCDISGPNPKNKAIKTIELPWKLSRPGAQLVECGGRLLIVAPFFCYHFDLESYHDLKMVELDVIKGSYSTITSLGSYTVFLGRNEGFSVDANQFPGIMEPNRIYFSDRSYRIASRGQDNVPRPDRGLAARGVWINL